MLDNSDLSRTFSLGTGRPQGDNLSPTQYNIGQQIQLFRLELDPNFKSVFQHFLKPNFPFPLSNIESRSNAKFANESASETDKKEGFADDTTAMGDRSKENVIYVKSILNEFASFSGLKCNFSKTSVMPVGNNLEMDQNESGGLAVVKDITLLGMSIDQNLAHLHNNFDVTIKKMEKSALFWSRFKLSLPGRIAVAKTFLLSLVNHLGCILMPLDCQLAKMQQIIDNFCIGPLNIGKDRLYLSPDMGGLGLISIRDFLIAQHTVWIKRALVSSRDNWRVDMYVLGFGNPLTVNPTRIDKTTHPILHGLASSFAIFNNAYTNTAKNFEKAFFFNNPAFLRNSASKNIIDLDCFNKSINLYEISKMRFCDLFSDGKIKSLRVLNEEYNLNLNAVGYLNLFGAAIHNKEKRKGSDGASISMTEFFASFKKGSKSCRNILAKPVKAKTDPCKFTSIITFFQLIGIEIPTRATVSNFVGIWNLSFIPNKLRDFIFKFYNNKLGLNTRTSHFGGDTRACTFCSLLKRDDTDETFAHLFYDCPAVELLHSSISVQYFIWGAKLGKFIPLADFVVGETVYLLDNACSLNLELDACRTKLNCVLSRHWNNLRARRW